MFGSTASATHHPENIDVIRLGDGTIRTHSTISNSAAPQLKQIVSSQTPRPERQPIVFSGQPVDQPDKARRRADQQQ